MQISINHWYSVNYFHQSQIIKVLSIFGPDAQVLAPKLAPKCNCGNMEPYANSIKQQFCFFIMKLDKIGQEIPTPYEI